MALDASKLRAVIEPHININTRLSSLRDVVEAFCREEGIPI